MAWICVKVRTETCFRESGKAVRQELPVQAALLCQDTREGQQELASSHNHHFRIVRFILPTAATG